MKFNTNKSLMNYALKPTEESCADVNLLCFANAGAGATMCRTWSDALGDDVDVWGAAYPGRDTLLQAPPANNLDELVAYYMADMSLFPDDGYILYGHSFGALVAYTLALKLQALGRSPMALCVGARRAPSMPAGEPLDVSSDEKLLAALKKLGGIPEALAKDSDMLAYFLPHIRHDLFLNETYVGRPVVAVDCPIYGFYSPSDRLVSEAEVKGWRRYSSVGFESVSLNGGHFFIQEASDTFFRELKNTIVKTVV